MKNDLLIVFSNYNGNRTCNDYDVPRQEATIQSFKNCVPDWSKYNAMLIDNNSSDGSEEILQSHAGGKWRYVKKNKEEYYLGTLRSLIGEISGQYKYILIIDNDHFFFKKEDFLTRSIEILDNNNDVICVQLNEPTKADQVACGGKMIAGIYDKIYTDKIWFRAAKFSGKEKWIRSKKLTRNRIISIPSFKPKRVCWLYFAYSVAMLRVDSIKNIFDRHKILKGEYKRNSDRIALFSGIIGKKGNTAYLPYGVAINIGFRENFDKKFKVKKLIEHYDKNNVKSFYVDSDHSFLYKGDNLFPIENEL